MDLIIIIIIIIPTSDLYHHIIPTSDLYLCLAHTEGDEVVEPVPVSQPMQTSIKSVPSKDPVTDGDTSKEDVEMRLQEIEESVTCNICLDRRRSVVFLCGHNACGECARGLRFCHMCRKPITKRINMF